jgi:tRNA (cmo5U34)-methyltransferase
MAGEEWTDDAEKVGRYLDRADEFPHRVEGEGVLLGQVPESVRRVLDLGTGDGRLLSLLLDGRRAMHGVGLDFSPIMLGAARERFEGEERVEIVEHDLAEPLPALGRFDAVVSSMAIHHLEHERKRSLYAEVFELLEPGGVFANFEHVASPTERLHLAFFAAIDEPIENADPSDRCSTSRPSSAGCARSASKTSTATGSGWRWRSSSASAAAGRMPAAKA